MSSNNQKALLLTTENRLKPVLGGFSLIPVSKRFEQNYIVHRINLPSIEVTNKMRDFIEQSMSEGKRFARVGNHTIMINSISGIDPLPRIHKLINLKGIYET